MWKKWDHKKDDTRARVMLGVRNRVMVYVANRNGAMVDVRFRNTQIGLQLMLGSEIVVVLWLMLGLGIGLWFTS